MRDIHSFSNPAESRVRHLELELDADFKRRVLRGTVVLHLDRAGGVLRLDARGLKIHAIPGFEWTVEEGLEIRIGGAQRVRIEYETSAGATALQWLDEPFLFTQSQSIHARSWIPLQDSPGLRVTFDARVTAPEGLTALMAAERIGAGRFRMPQAIPPYLLALAVGRLEFRPLGSRSGVWAAPEVVEAAAREFEDLESMITATERLFGPYRWDRQDVLVMPASFPFGGMENPRLTFATPTILSGDKSLVSLIAHELAHAWSGNLVTNATWRDFWLNEGFTTYIERRIQEEIFGERRARMEEALELVELRAEMRRLPAADQILAVDLTGRDPDEGCTLVPYVKGAAMLRMLEHTHGREKFDRFVRAWFDEHAFQSVTTEEFLEFYERRLGGPDLREWIFEPGLPASLIEPVWERESAPREGWCTQEWLLWLRDLDADAGRMADWDRQWGFTASRNSEIAAQWLAMAARCGYEAANERIEDFLRCVGRRKFVEPIYRELVSRDAARARQIYSSAKAGYHPMTRAAVEKVLLLK